VGRIQGDLAERTLDFALDVLSTSKLLPSETRGWVIGKQLCRSGTSIGANVREADVALTDADFAYKISIARKEACETEYWIELAIRAALLPPEETQTLLSEAGELSRILSTIVRKTQAHIPRNK